MAIEKNYYTIDPEGGQDSVHEVPCPPHQG